MIARSADTFFEGCVDFVRRGLCRAEMSAARMNDNEAQQQCVTCEKMNTGDMYKQRMACRGMHMLFFIQVRMAAACRCKHVAVRRSNAALRATDLCR